MRTITFLASFSSVIFVNAQSGVEWNGKYQIQFSDFRSPGTQIGGGTIYSLGSGSSIDFSFYMTNYEFAFTKNFNSKVRCLFNPDAASLVAPDSLQAETLLNFSRFDFDLCELYSRKLRKKLYEEKRAFSNVNYFRPYYDEIKSEHAKRHAQAVQDTDIGRNREVLAHLHRIVLDEIDSLTNYCKTCKPQKKKK
jgi:hypothetical protein